VRLAGEAGSPMILVTGSPGQPAGKTKFVVVISKRTQDYSF